MTSTAGHGKPLMTLAALLLAALPAAWLRPGEAAPDPVAAAARRIDELVEADLARHGLEPNPIADDATFARRAWLGIAGRIPAAAETEAFLASHEADKRSRLVDRLLDSPGHGSRMFNWWADLLRVRTRLNRQISGEPYIHWIKEAVARNVPYDRFVSELLTADGPAHRRGNGATGYYLRDLGMPEDNMANTVRVFLGTRLECAQCHDHPFDKWKQKQFFEMAAFTGGIQYRDRSLRRTPEGRKLLAMGRELRREGDREMLRAYRRQVILRVTPGVFGSGAGLTRLPHDYQYDDAKPNQPMKPFTIFGNAPKPGDDPHKTYAEWMTSPENPRFTMTIVNRLWKVMFGRGFVTPR